MLAVGIDLGTTNSLAAIFCPSGDIEIVKAKNGDELLPSAISVTDEGTILIGAGAKSRLVSKPAVTAVSFKRSMGTEKQISLSGKTYTASELSSLILKELIQNIGEQYDDPIETLVITVPAYFNSIQREQTRLAAELAGVTTTRLINEPTAAALAYGLHDRDDECTFMILDLGGGTFDVSILEMFDGVFEVRASSGDPHLGGEDFTHALSLHVTEQLNRNYSALSPDEKESVYRISEEMKHALSAKTKVTGALILDGDEHEIHVNRETFEDACFDLSLRFRKPIEQCIYDAKISIDDVDRVVLVGGATRMPLIRSMAAKLFKKLPERGLDPDKVVAMGAAIQAGLCQKNQALDDIVMTDVAPFSLGILSGTTTGSGYISDVFFPIIERNTILPASRSHLFCTREDNQSKVSILIYQGESPIATDNILLDRMDINVPRGPAGEEAVEVRFSYDTSGLLEVDVTAVSTQEKMDVVINQGGKQMSPGAREESLKKLARLKWHPRDQIENQEILEKLKELYATRLGADRTVIVEIIGKFTSALDTQDPRVIAKALEEAKRSAKQFEHYHVF